jgi:hypothetical protein
VPKIVAKELTVNFSSPDSVHFHTNDPGVEGVSPYCFPACASPRYLNDTTARRAAEGVTDKLVQSGQPAADGREPRACV